MKIIKKPERLEKTLSFRLTKLEFELLKDMAKKEKVSRNLVIRSALQSFYEENQS